MNKNPFLGFSTLVAAALLIGPGSDAEEVPVQRQRGSNKDGHRYYPPRKSHSAPGMGRDKKPPTPAQALFASHQSAGLSKAEKNASKRERRSRIAK